MDALIAYIALALMLSCGDDFPGTRPIDTSPTTEAKREPPKTAGEFFVGQLEESIGNESDCRDEKRQLLAENKDVLIALIEQIPNIKIAWPDPVAVTSFLKMVDDRILDRAAIAAAYNLSSLIENARDPNREVLTSLLRLRDQLVLRLSDSERKLAFAVARDLLANDALSSLRLLIALTQGKQKFLDELYALTWNFSPVFLAKVPHYLGVNWFTTKIYQTGMWFYGFDAEEAERILDLLAQLINNGFYKEFLEVLQVVEDKLNGNASEDPPNRAKGTWVGAATQFIEAYSRITPHFQDVPQELIEVFKRIVANDWSPETARATKKLLPAVQFLYEFLSIEAQFGCQINPAVLSLTDLETGIKKVVDYLGNTDNGIMVFFDVIRKRELYTTCQ